MAGTAKTWNCFFMTTWTLADRAAKMNPSAIREILKLTDRPGIISMAGGLPSPLAFPLDEFTQACQTVMQRDGASALQYATSEGFAPLRQAVADFLPWEVDPDQVLITTGSQQALDLIGKVFLDRGSRMLVEKPTYLGALQAFAPQEPIPVGVDSDDDGILVEDFAAKAGTGADKARLAYVLPNFQNPTGRTMAEARRQALVDKARELNIPLIEDNPYGDLWFEQAPALPLAARNPEGVIYLGSFSKVLAPGLRIGFLDRHVPTIRAMYKRQRDAMLAALEREMAGLDVQWTRPVGGMFLWVRLPKGMDAQKLLPAAVERGTAFVPGAPFYADEPQANTLRLSYVTVSAEQIDKGIAALADAIRSQLSA
jgi:2-aminoadipate transaminase